MPIPQVSLVLLFVTDSLVSSAFYQRLLKLKPIEEAPTFALFALPNDLMLGLWSDKTAEPPTAIKGGGCEISFNVEDVDEVYKEWLTLDIPIAQKPTDMDFGRTFVALDPDGHRIRVHCLKEPHV